MREGVIRILEGEIKPLSLLEESYAAGAEMSDDAEEQDDEVF